MTTDQQTIARPPTRREILFNKVFRSLTVAAAWVTILSVVLLIGLIGWDARYAMERLGFGFLIGTHWNDKDGYGILPEIWGTMFSSVLGVLIGSVFGISIAIYLTQNFLPAWLEDLFKNIFSLLAAIPSVVYGLWGIFVVIPVIRPPCNWLHKNLGWIPLFDEPLVSVGLLPAALVLAIMVLPTVTAISRDALASVNPKIREAAYGLGATRWETILGVIVPTAMRGIYGSVILGFGRAIGETMALAMLVGSTPSLRISLFYPANTLAALLANKFPEAAGDMDRSRLMFAALVLLGLSLLVNSGGEWIVRRSAAKTAGTTK
jgi:phosphate transport system permease protein